jgi:hypothetical protein
VKFDGVFYSFIARGCLGETRTYTHIYMCVYTPWLYPLIILFYSEGRTSFLNIYLDLNSATNLLLFIYGFWWPQFWYRRRMRKGNDGVVNS